MAGRLARRLVAMDTAEICDVSTQVDINHTNFMRALAATIGSDEESPQATRFAVALMGNAVCRIFGSPIAGMNQLGGDGTKVWAKISQAIKCGLDNGKLDPLVADWLAATFIPIWRDQPAPEKGRYLASELERLWDIEIYPTGASSLYEVYPLRKSLVDGYSKRAPGLAIEFLGLVASNIPPIRRGMVKFLKSQ